MKKLKPIGADLLCQCGQCSPSMTFRCAKCARDVPYCYGAADKYYKLCDDCAVVAMEKNQKWRGLL
jgi:hypothetical protein